MTKEYLRYAAKLLRITKQLIKVLDLLPTQWSTPVHLKADKETVLPGLFKFLKNIFKVIAHLFFFYLLSFMLLHIEGHSFGIDRDNKITHNFLVDDLKLYSRNAKTSKKRLDLVTTFQQHHNDI